MCGCLSRAPYWGPAHNPGMCPDWELNQRPFGSQAGAHFIEPHQPGHLPPILTPHMHLLNSEGPHQTGHQDSNGQQQPVPD